jgi:hypothetical protein
VEVPVANKTTTTQEYRPSFKEGRRTYTLTRKKLVRTKQDKLEYDRPYPKVVLNKDLDTIDTMPILNAY